MGQKFIISFLIYSIHHKMVQVIARVIYEISNKISPTIVNEVFPLKATLIIH